MPGPVHKSDLLSMIQRAESNLARLKAEKQSIELQIQAQESALAEVAEMARTRLEQSSAPHVEATRKGPSKKPASPRRAVPQPHTAPPADNMPQQSGKRRRHSEVSAALRRLIFNQTDEYTGPQIMEQMRKVNPTLAVKIPPGYISTILWRMAQAEQIALVRQGGPGLPHIYCNHKK